MKCDIRMTIGLAIIAAIAGVGVTLAVLKDIQLRTDLFSASPSSPDQEASVSQERAEDDADSESRPAPVFEMAQGGLNTEQSEAEADRDTADRAGAQARAGAVPDTGRHRSDLGSGTLEEPRTTLETPPRLIRAATDEPSGGSAVKEGAERDAAAADGAVAERSRDEGEKPNAAGSSGGSGQAAMADASEAEGGAGAADRSQAAERDGSGDSESSDEQQPKLKSLGEVDYSKMSQNISQVSDTLERFNEKLLKAIGQAKKKQKEQEQSDGAGESGHGEPSSLDAGAAGEEGGSGG